MNKFCIFLLLGITVYAQETRLLVSPNFGSTRSNGAGNCYTIHALGAEGIFGNPAQINLADNAALLILENMQPWASAQASGTYIDATYSQYDLVVDPYYSLPQIALTLPYEYAYKKKMTFGLGFRTLYNTANTWSVDAKYVQDSGILQWSEETTGLVKEITASAGITVNHHYSFGLTIGLPIYSHLEIATHSNQESINSPLRKESLTSDYDISADMSFQLGFLYHTENFRAGFSAFKKNQLAISQIKHTLSDGSNSIQAKQYYEYPHLLSMGIAYRPIKLLWLYSQFSNRSWNKIMYSGEYLDDLPAGYVASAGFEWGNFFQVRGGYSRDIRANQEAADLMSVEQSIHAGMGLNKKNHKIDIAVQYLFYDYSENVLGGQSQIDYRFENLILSISYNQTLPLGLSYRDF